MRFPGSTRFRECASWPSPPFCRSDVVTIGAALFCPFGLGCSVSGTLPRAHGNTITCHLLCCDYSTITCRTSSDFSKFFQWLVSSPIGGKFFRRPCWDCFLRAGVLCFTHGQAAANLPPVPGKERRVVPCYGGPGKSGSLAANSPGFPGCQASGELC